MVLVSRFPFFDVFLRKKVKMLGFLA